MTRKSIPRLGFMILLIFSAYFLICSEEAYQPLSINPTPSPEGTPTPTYPITFVNITGRAHEFGLTVNYVRGGIVTILEHPEFQTTTDDNGYFSFEDVPGYSEATFVLSHPDFVPLQTETFFLEEEDLTTLTFQAPGFFVYGAFTALLGVFPDKDTCQISSTVSTEGRSIWDIGEPGATVSIEPPVSVESGPYYFNERTLPLRTVTETSTDGGIVFVNVLPAEYTIRAHKQGVDFRDVKIKCREGFLVNASPPWGLQGKPMQEEENND